MIRYFDAYAIDTLESRRLKVSAPSLFNDPFEFIMNHEASEWPDDVLRRVMDHNLRVICFSDLGRITPDGDILMWSHYAKAHSGFRIHFEDDALAGVCTERMEIDYEKVIPRCPELIQPENDPNEQQIIQCYRHAFGAKGTFWSYEKEIRFFFERALCRCDRNRKFDYVRFPAKSVTRVDIGLQTPRDDSARMLAVINRRAYRHVAVFEARRVSGRYAIEYIET